MNHHSDTDVKQLQDLVIEMSKTITRLTDDMYLRGVVGSVFDTQSVEDTIAELKALNEGERPEWLFTVKDMTELNITELLKKAEDLVHDGYMDAAEKCIIPVQRIEDENGGYEIFLVAVRDKKEFENNFLKPRG